jgi:TPR repeat protein
MVSQQLKSNEVPVCDLEAVRKLAQGGHVYEQNQLGIASLLAISPELNTQMAIDWFTKSARQGYAPAEVNLGVLNANGWGVPQNYAQALYWFERAAEQHYPRAYYNLGILYLNGSGVRQDYQAAAIFPPGRSCWRCKCTDQSWVYL